jgi:hypothetical protein
MRRLISLTTLVAALICMGGTALAGGQQLKISISKEDVNLEKRTLDFRINKDCSVAEIKVYDLEGNVLSEKLETYDGAEAGTKLSISWPRIISDPNNFKIELKVTDVNDFWVGFEIVHFYGAIPHEEVIFESGKWDIPATESPKLDEVIPKIVEMVQKFQKFSSQMSYSLYVAGHTDTVGNTTDNRKLSDQRAQAIAKYLMANGLNKLKISIFVRGFGEEALAVQTGDNKDEAANRRADYIISNFPPAMNGPGSWRRIKK